MLKEARLSKSIESNRNNSRRTENKIQNSKSQNTEQLL